jgi:hypothetical protein
MTSCSSSIAYRAHAVLGLNARQGGTQAPSLNRPAQRPLAGFSSSLRGSCGLQLQRAAGGRGQGSSRAQGPVRVQALFEK